MHIIEEICDCVEVNIEKPSHFSKIIEKSPQHEPIEDKTPQGDVHWRKGKSIKVEFVIPPLNTLLEMQKRDGIIGKRAWKEY